MKTKNIFIAIGSVVAISALIFLLKPAPQAHPRPEKAMKESEKIKLDTINIYLENSGSMFGFVKNNNNFVSVVTELANKMDFVGTNIHKHFWLINGDPCELTDLGNNPSVLSNSLNEEGLTRGDIQNSNLNQMFKIALQNAGKNKIAILISDGIYDIENTSDPLQSLNFEGRNTRTKFVERLLAQNIQTTMVKLSSDFQGYYYFATAPGSTRINQERPYYLWILGNHQLLNQFFSKSYLSNLPGYQESAHFFKYNKKNVDYQIFSEPDLEGSFRTDRKNSKRLINTELSRNRKFQFKIAIDYSNLPLSDELLNDTSQYEIEGNYSIKSVSSVQNLNPGITINPTNIMLLESNRPYGSLKIHLKNTPPGWISHSSTTDDSDIQNDQNSTFGLNQLTKGIIEAYKYVSDEEYYTSFEIMIQK